MQGMTDLLYDTKHHCLIALPRVQLQKLLKVSKELSALFHLDIDLSDISQIVINYAARLTLSTALFQAAKALNTFPTC